MKNPIHLAGGGDVPQQQQQMIQMPVTPPEPPKQDNALLWAGTVVVPVLVALIGLWAVKHRKT